MIIRRHPLQFGGELNAVWNALPWQEVSRDDRGWAAGGSVRRTLANEPLANDIDLFFTGPKSFETFTRAFGKMTGVFMTANPAHVMQFDFFTNAGRYVIQCVRRRFFENVEDLLADFDFTICQFAFDGSTFYSGESAFDDLCAKRLRVANAHTPVATLRRFIKYSGQGFRAKDDDYKAFLKSVAERPELIDAPLTTSDVLPNPCAELDLPDFMPRKSAWLRG